MEQLARADSRRSSAGSATFEGGDPSLAVTTGSRLRSLPKTSENNDARTLAIQGRSRSKCKNQGPFHLSYSFTHGSFPRLPPPRAGSLAGKGFECTAEGVLGLIGYSGKRQVRAAQPVHRYAESLERPQGTRKVYATYACHMKMNSVVPWFLCSFKALRLIGQIHLRKKPNNS